MKELKKDLREVQRSLKLLIKKTEQMAKKLEKLEKAQVPKKTKPEPKATKQVVSRKATRITATDTVLSIIKRSRKGVDTATLKEKTGFKDNNIRAILSRLRKQGKIKRSAEKGVYMKV